MTLSTLLTMKMIKYQTSQDSAMVIIPRNHHKHWSKSDVLDRAAHTEKQK